MDRRELNVGTWDIIDDIYEALEHMGFDPDEFFAERKVYNEDDLIDFALSYLYAHLSDIDV